MYVSLPSDCDAHRSMLGYGCGYGCGASWLMALRATRAGMYALPLSQKRSWID